jgi:hypothetical protein
MVIRFFNNIIENKDYIKNIHIVWEYITDFEFPSYFIEIIILFFNFRKHE